MITWNTMTTFEIHLSKLSQFIILLSFTDLQATLLICSLLLAGTKWLKLNTDINVCDCKWEQLEINIVNCFWIWAPSTNSLKGSLEIAFKNSILTPTCNKVMLQISKTLCTITTEISSPWIADIVIVMHNTNKLVSTNDISVHVSCWLMTAK